MSGDDVKGEFEVRFEGEKTFRAFGMKMGRCWARMHAEGGFEADRVEADEEERKYKVKYSAFVKCDGILSLFHRAYEGEFGKDLAVDTSMTIDPLLPVAVTEEYEFRSLKCRARRDFEDDNDPSGFDGEVVPFESTGSSFTPKFEPPLVPPPSETNIPATKHWVFNETGNIMVASTADGSQEISKKAQSLFEEVAVFFAALTKAVSQTPRPTATEPYTPLDFYTLFDWAPIDAMVRRSGMFVEMERDTIFTQYDSGDASINLKLVESLLGFAATDGADLFGVIGVLKSMGQQATFGYKKTNTSQKMGHLLFICEYMMGMPLVSAQYYYLDEDDVEWMATSPSLTTDHVTRDLTIHKETYLFVPPPWIAKYGPELSSVAGDAAFGSLVAELESYITGQPSIFEVTTASPTSEDGYTAITANDTCTITGDNFPTTPAKSEKAPGTVSIGGVVQTTTPADWASSTKITFKATAGSDDKQAFGQVLVHTNDGKSATSAEFFEVVTPK